MADGTHVYEDQWGEIIDRPASDLIELRWFDTTATMSKEDFQQWLRTFADRVALARRHRVLVDGISFKMNPAFMDGEWRDANIIPTYNDAGVSRFAFLMPMGMPMIGQAPAKEGPGRFPTGYFSTRRGALEWLLT